MGKNVVVLAAAAALALAACCCDVKHSPGPASQETPQPIAGQVAQAEPEAVGQREEVRFEFGTFDS